MPSFDTHLIFCFCDLVERVYEHTNEANFAYLYARILFDMAYEEIYQESLLDGIYTCVYQKADKAVAALLSAWKKAPNRTSFTRVCGVIDIKENATQSSIVRQYGLKRTQHRGLMKKSDAF